VLHIEITDREKQDLAEMMLPGLVTEYGLALGLAEFRRIIRERNTRNKVARCDAGAIDEQPAGAR
jgi:hypothetical protein